MEEIRTRKNQVLILIAFCLSLASIASLTVTFATITTQVKDIYQVDVFYVEGCSSIFYISYVVFLLPAYYFEDYFGVRKTLIFGCVLMTLGAFIRIGAYQNFWWIGAGTVIASVSQPFFLNQVTKISQDWFDEETRVITSSISMICYLIGQGGSYGLSGVFVQEDHGKDQVGRLMIFNSIFSFVSLLLVWLFLKDRPKGGKIVRPYKPVKEEIFILFKDFYFICLLVSSGLHMAVGNYFGVVLEIIVKDCGMQAEDASYIGTITIMTGITSCIICSLISSRTGKYKKILIVCIGGTIFLYLGMYFSIKSQNFSISAFVGFLYGMVLLPVYSLSLEFACEITYPVREILTSGLINCFGQIFSVIPILVSFWFDNSSSVCIQISVFFQVIAFISICFTKEDLKRKHAETITKAKNDFIPSYS